MDSLEDDFAFYSAIEQGNIELVKEMIDKGIDIHTNNERPLRLAQEYKHCEIEELLKNHGSKIEEEDRSWVKFPTIKQLMSLMSVDKIPENILQKKYKYSLIGKPIETCIDKQDNLKEIVKLDDIKLMKKCIEYYNITNVDESVIYQAIEFGQIEMVDYMISLTSIDLHKDRVISILFDVINNGNHEMANYILKLANIELDEILGHSLKTKKGWDRNYKVLKFFIKEGSFSKNVFTQKILKLSVKHLDCEKIDLIELVLAKNPEYTKKQVAMQAIRHNNINLVKYFLEDFYIQKALMSAIYFGHLDIVKYLISIGGDPSKFNEKGLRLALRNERADIAFFLMGTGSKANIALKYCCNKNYKRSKQIVESFLEFSVIECGICLNLIEYHTIFTCKTCKKFTHQECQNKWGRKCIYCRN